VQRCFGWQTKGVFAESVEESDFLSSNFVLCKSGAYLMIPMIGRLLAKLFWTWRHVTDKNRADYCRPIAESFMPTFQGFEFMEKWLSWHRRRPVGKRCRYVHYKPEVIPVARGALWSEFLFRRYGLSLPPRDLIEQLDVPFSKVAIINHAWSEAVMKYDLADPAARPITNL
jgi:hypothetical protein